MHRQILRLAIPNIISNISVPLISTVDTVLMGDLSTLHLGAIGLGSMIFNFLYWNFGFLRMGTTGMTAQAFGAEDKNELSNIFYRSALVGILISVLLYLIGHFGQDAAMNAMNVSSEQKPLVQEYIIIRLYDAPATIMLYVLFGWFFGLQNAIIPLILTVIINVLNIIISIYLVNSEDMGISGAAWGSVIAQYIGILVAAAIIIIRYKSYLIWDLDAIVDLEKLKRFFRINSDLFLRTICLSSAFFFFYAQSSRAGADILAINVILLQFVNWMSYGIDGFAYAAESLVGRFAGAKDLFSLDKAIKYSILWGLVLAIGYALVYGGWFYSLVNLFSDEVSQFSSLSEFRSYIIILPLVGFLCYIWDGIYVGLTASRLMRNTMLISLICYLAVYYSLSTIIDSQAIWIALIIFLFMRGLLMSIIYRFRKDSLIEKVKP